MFPAGFYDSTLGNFDNARQHTLTLINSVLSVYYPTEVRRGKYWGLGVFLLQYFPLVKI